MFKLYLCFVGACGSTVSLHEAYQECCHGLIYPTLGWSCTFRLASEKPKCLPRTMQLLTSRRVSKKTPVRHLQRTSRRFCGGIRLCDQSLSLVKRFGRALFRAETVVTGWSRKRHFSSFETVFVSNHQVSSPVEMMAEKLWQIISFA